MQPPTSRAQPDAIGLSHNPFSCGPSCLHPLLSFVFRICERLLHFADEGAQSGVCAALKGLLSLGLSVGFSQGLTLGTALKLQSLALVHMALSRCAIQVG